MPAYKLLDNVSGNTTGTTFVCDGGKKNLYVSAGTWGTGTTVTIKARPTGSELPFVTLQDNGAAAAYTADALRVLDFLAQDMDVQAVVSGSSGAATINAYIL